MDLVRHAVPARRAGRAVALLSLLLAVPLAAQTPPSPAPPVPPAPTRHFTDEAALITAEAGQQLDQTLSRFEADTGHQFIVVVYPTLGAAHLEEFTLRAANAWGIGRKDHDDGVVLFVFAQDRRLRLEVGRGLEMRLTNAACQRIIDEQIVPAFRRGDHAAGLQAGVTAVMEELRRSRKPSSSVETR